MKKFKKFKKLKNFVFGASSVVLFSGAVALLENNVFGDIEYEYQDVTLVLPKDGSFEDHRFCENNEIAEEYMMTLGASIDSFNVIEGVELTKATGDGEINIPNEIDDKPVLKLGKNLFANINESVTGEVIIPKNVVYIGDGAFKDCFDLNGLSFEEGSELLVIGQQAFDGCTEMTGDLILPEKLRLIEEAAFRQCGFCGNLVLNSNLVKIGNDAFESCSNFCFGEDKILRLPKNIKELGKSVFESASFEGVEFPSECLLKSINKCVFKDALGNTDEQHTLEIPKNVTLICESAFQNCNFKNIILNDGLEIISDNSFAGGNLGNVVIIPSSVKTIGKDAFNGAGVKCFVFKENNDNLNIEEGAFVDICYFLVVNLDEKHINNENFIYDDVRFISVEDKYLESVIEYLQKYDKWSDANDIYSIENIMSDIEKFVEGLKENEIE